MTSRAFGAVLALVFPGIAAAAPTGLGDMTGALAIANTWVTTSLGLAIGLWLAMTLLALLLEAFWKAPGEPREFGAVVWRALVVFALLVHPRGSSSSLYGKACYAMAGLADMLTGQLSPQDVWVAFATAQDKWQTQLAQQAVDTDSTVGYLGRFGAGVLYDSLIAIAIGLGQASLWVMGVLGQVLAAMLFTVGPLALVFAVPRVSDAMSRWLRSFISILAWPVLSAMMLNIIVQAGLKGMANASPAFGSMATALIMGVVALAVPVVASSLVGGSVGALSAGMGTLMSGGARLAAAATSAGGGVAMAGQAAMGGARAAAPALGALGELVNPSAGALPASGPPGDVKWGRDVAKVASADVSPQADAAVTRGLQTGAMEGAGGMPRRAPFAGLLNEAAASQAMGSSPAGIESAAGHGSALGEAAQHAPTSEPDSTWAEEGAAHHRPHHGSPGGGGGGHSPVAPADPPRFALTDGEKAAAVQFVAAAAGGVIGGDLGAQRAIRAAQQSPNAAAPQQSAAPYPAMGLAAAPGAGQPPARPGFYPSGTAHTQQARSLLTAEAEREAWGSAAAGTPAPTKVEGAAKTTPARGPLGAVVAPVPVAPTTTASIPGDGWNVRVDSGGSRLFGTIPSRRADPHEAPTIGPTKPTRR